MRGKLQHLPAAMEDADRKLKTENERLAQLQRLEPVNEKVVKLKAELPGMRQQLDDVTQRLEKLRLEVTEVRRPSAPLDLQVSCLREAGVCCCCTLERARGSTVSVFVR